MGNQNQSGQSQPQDPKQQDPKQQDPKDNGSGKLKSVPQQTPGKNADQQRNGGG